MCYASYVFEWFIIVFVLCNVWYYCSFLILTPWLADSFWGTGAGAGVKKSTGAFGSFTKKKRKKKYNYQFISYW